MTKFVQLSKIKSYNNISNLLKNHKVEFSVQNLKLLKNETRSYGSLLLLLLKEMLTNDICFDPAREFKDDV